MRNIFKPLCLLAIAYLCLNNRSIAQKGNKGRANNNKSLPIPKGPVEDNNSKPIPKELSQFEVANSQSQEDFLTYFVNEVKQTTGILFVDKLANSKTKVSIDSLLPRYREYVDSFIAHKIKKKKRFENYLWPEKYSYIYKTLNAESEKTYYVSDAFLNETGNTIQRLPASKEKVYLQLQYASILINRRPVETFYDVVMTFADSAKRQADEITNLYERAKSYEYIGDFFAQKGLEPQAMRFFYFARIFLVKSNLEWKSRNMEEGILCEKISDLFAGKNYFDAIQKQIEYLDEANSCFSKAGKSKRINENRAFILESEAYYYFDFWNDNISFDSALHTQRQLNTLSDLASLYKEQKNSNKQNSQTLYLVNKSIGVILYAKGMYEEALKFFLIAFPYSAMEYWEDRMGTCLSLIGDCYAELGDKKNALEFCDLQTYLYTNTGNYLGLAEATLDRADMYRTFGINDSALTITNSFTENTTFINSINPYEIDKLLLSANTNKYNLFNNTNKDSSAIYRKKVDTGKELRRDMLSILIDIESNESKYFTSLFYNNEITSLKNQAKLLNKETESLIRHVSLLGDTIKVKNGIIFNLANSERALRNTNSNLFDSINEQNNTLKRLKSQNQLLDSISRIQGGRIAIQKQKLQTWTIVGIIGALAAILLPLAVGSHIVRRKRKQISELNRDKQKLLIETTNLKTVVGATKEAHESDLRYQNEKIIKEYTLKHEIVGILNNLYASFENVTSEINTGISDVTESLSSFQEKLKRLVSFVSIYYRSLEKDDYNSVDTEVCLAAQYVDFIKLKTNGDDIYFHDKRSYKKQGIVLPHHILNNFTKNAIEKGKQENKVLNIDVTDKIENDEYIIQVTDNGKGVGEMFDITNLDKDSTGIKNLQKQVEFYNTRKDNTLIIELGTEFIVDRKGIDGYSGTVVTLRIKPKYASS